MKASPLKTRSLRMAGVTATLVALCASGCAVYDDYPTRVYEPAQSQLYPYDSVYVDPPMSEPSPIAVPWAPPPMLMEVPPPMPFLGAVWVGGYWVWQGDWVWATGRWAPPPRPDYTWVHPYYEHRDGVVIFITGHWCPPGVAFVPPPRGLRLNVVAASRGARRGHAPVGPQGVFLPPPPGSRPGLIVPAPIGTPPAVMRGAPPVVNVGMRIQNTGQDRQRNTSDPNVHIVAPAGATSTGRPFNAAVPAQPNRQDPRQPVAMPPQPAPSLQQAPTPITNTQRPRPDAGSPGAWPAPVPAWRGAPGQPAPGPGPVREHERERDGPRANGGRAVRMQDRPQQPAQERWQEQRVPVERQRPGMPSARGQANPAPFTQQQQPAPPRQDDRVRMAPPAQAAAQGAGQQPRREQAPRGQRPAGEKFGKDKNDPRGE